MQRCPSERVGSVLKPTMGFEGFRILEAAIRKVPSPPANTDQISYRVMLVVWHLDWVDLHLIHSTTCLDLLGLPGLWPYGQSKWADCWNF